jgi:hypothetical protein
MEATMETKTNPAQDDAAKAENYNKTIEAALRRGIEEALCLTPRPISVPEFQEALLKRIKGNVKDAIAHKVTPGMWSKNLEIREAVTKVWNSLFPEDMR